MAPVLLSVGVSSDVEGGGVVEEPVEEGDGEDGVGEDLVPLAVALVARDDRAFAGCVAFVDRFEQERRVFSFEGLEADFVEDE